MSTSLIAKAPARKNASLSCCAGTAGTQQAAASACCAPSSRASASQRRLSFFGNPVLREMALRDALY